jgi:hypothetical protein
VLAVELAMVMLLGTTNPLTLTLVVLAPWSSLKVTLSQSKYLSAEAPFCQTLAPLVCHVSEEPSPFHSRSAADPCAERQVDLSCG